MIWLEWLVLFCTEITLLRRKATIWDNDVLICQVFIPHAVNVVLSRYMGLQKLQLIQLPTFSMALIPPSALERLLVLWMQCSMVTCCFITWHQLPLLLWRRRLVSWWKNVHSHAGKRIWIVLQLTSEYYPKRPIYSRVMPSVTTLQIDEHTNLRRYVDRISSQYFSEVAPVPPVRTWVEDLDDATSSWSQAAQVDCIFKNLVYPHWITKFTLVDDPVSNSTSSIQVMM